MKGFILLISSIFVLSITAIGGTPAEKIDYLISSKASTENVALKNLVSDATFVRRAYLDVVGRIPTHKEQEDFGSMGATKRADLIVKLLQSEGHVQYLYHFWADLLRIRDGRLSDNANLRGITYLEWMKEQIRINTPYDEFVRGLLTAEGEIWTNPAVGYYLRDSGMHLDNFSNTAQVFMGIDLSCAQCHDDPFQDWTQLDFYQMAAFTISNDNKLAMNKEESAIYNEFNKVVRGLQDEAAKAQREGTKTTLNRGRLNQMRNFANVSFRYYIQADETNKLTLPHDYQYDDAEPKSVVEPKLTFGPEVEVVESDPRKTFAQWMTNTTHPSFTRNIVNRMWEHLMGTPLVDNMDNMYSDNEGKNVELLNYLESLMIEVNYDLKRFQYNILTTKAYQRIAHEDDSGIAYVGQAPQARRLTSTQLWDSYLVLRLGDVDTFTAPDWRSYKVASLTSDQLTVDSVGQSMDAVALVDSSYYSGVQKHKSLMLIRSSFINGDGKTRANQNLLSQLGFSDRKLVNDSSGDGSVAQVLLLANGPILDLVLDKESHFLKGIGRDDKTDYIWLSFLQRRPTMFEKSMAKRLPNEDLVWAILNSQEFRFTP